MKLIFLGAGSAFTVGNDNYQSNMFIQDDNGDGLLIDCGTDARLSLNEQNLNLRNINDIYISHLHTDHIGGLEWLAISTYFLQKPRHHPKLHIAQELVAPLWENALSAGLSTVQDFQATLSTYFEIDSIQNNSFTWKGITFELVPGYHTVSNHELMPCYGLFFTINGKRIFLTTDTRFVPEKHQDYYDEADIIFQDCETYTEKSGLHAHYTELVTLPPEIKRKMWLYHYAPGPLPDALADGFCGFVSKGQVFEF